MNEENNNNGDSEYIRLFKLYEKVHGNFDCTAKQFFKWAELWKTIELMEELGMLKNVTTTKQVDESEEPPRKRRRIIRPKHRVNRKQKN